jgi:hypothetical protein
MKIARIEERISNLVDMRTDSDIFKEEYRTRRAKLDAELESAQAELAETPVIMPFPQEYKLRWAEIEQTLNQLIDFSGDKVNEDVVDKFIRRITPLGNNRYAFYLNIDNGLAESFTAAVKGRKGNAVISMENSEGDGEPPPPVHNIINLKLLQGLQSGKKVSAKNRVKPAFSEELFLVLQTTYRRLCGRESCRRDSIWRA